MTVIKPHINEQGLYFLTFTNYKWLPLFQMTNSYDLVYNWFDHLKKKGHYITAYVIMPDHIHALIGFVKCDKSINTIVSNGKRFMSYEIVKRLEASGQTKVLSELMAGVSDNERRKGTLHKVFERSFDMKECYNLHFINQKVNYIHNNPLSKKWALAQDTISYDHSSARFYETGSQGIYEVTNFIDLFDKNWNIPSSVSH